MSEETTLFDAYIPTMADKGLLEETQEVGRGRYESAVRLKSVSSAGLPTELQPHLDGAYCEAQIGLWLPGEWTRGVDAWHLADVDEYEVRSSRNPDATMPLRMSDAKHLNDGTKKLDRPFIFVILMEDGSCRVRGWVYGVDVIRAEYWQSKPKTGAAYWAIPQKELKPFIEFPGSMNRRWRRVDELVEKGVLATPQEIVHNRAAKVGLQERQGESLEEYRRRCIETMTRSVKGDRR